MANHGKTEVQNHQQEKLQQCASATGFADDSVRRRRYLRLIRLSRTQLARQALVLISTALMLKCVSNLMLRLLQGFIDSLFQLMAYRSSAQTTLASADGPKASTSISRHRHVVKSSIWSLMPPDWKYGRREMEIEKARRGETRAKDNRI